MKIEIEATKLSCDCGGYSIDGKIYCSKCDGYEYYYTTEYGQIINVEPCIEEKE